MKVNIPCQTCGKERMIDVTKNSITRYTERHPNCHSCAAQKPEVVAKISRGWFTRERLIGNQHAAGHKPWNDGLKGIHLSPASEFKYKNGTGYRRLLGRVLPAECKQCGEQNMKRLHVHHKDRNRMNNSMSNLEVLCRPCHLQEHGRIERTYVEGRKAAPMPI